MSRARVANAVSSAARATWGAATRERRRANLFDLASTLEGRGIGRAFVKRSWTARPETHGNTFWRLTRVRTRPSGRSGEAYGVLTWKGREREGEERITGSMKPIWARAREYEGRGEDDTSGPVLKRPQSIDAVSGEE